jgi:methylated-DNA-protein-cysteine methyltransferase-like protein
MGRLLDALYANAMASDDTNDAAGRIRAAIRASPAGEVAGYGEVARRAGLPGRARMVARLPQLPSQAALKQTSGGF